MDILITNYLQKTMSDEIIQLFKEIYPDRSIEDAKRMAYEENRELHVSTQVAIVDGKMVGQANVFRLANEPRIANLGYHVHPDYRQRGIAAKLSSVAIEYAKNSGVKILIVQTEASNQAAINLAKKLEFKKPSIVFLREYADRL
ncbi:MAG: GNAT family N-acetyltransferase, partial [Spirochaetota bacterium]